MCNSNNGTCAFIKKKLQNVLYGSHFLSKNGYTHSLKFHATA